MSTSYLVAATRAWNEDLFRTRTPELPGTWHLARTPAELEALLVQGHDPRYIFLPHWSWKVPPEIIQRYECIGFHMTDLPYGRGGSPLQNLIARGHRTTQLCAFRLGPGLDDGPVYARSELSLEGAAHEIYAQASALAFDLIGEIVTHAPQPVPQTGTPVLFERRRPEQSRIPEGLGVTRLYDHIRMLDADGYPVAFIEVGACRYEFREARLDGAAVEARVTIRLLPGAPEETETP